MSGVAGALAGPRPVRLSPLPFLPGPDSLGRERVDGASDEHEPGQEQLVLGPGHGGECWETAGTPATSALVPGSSSRPGHPGVLGASASGPGVT